MGEFPRFQNATLILGEDWRNKTSIIIPEYITSIGEGVFEGTMNLQDVIIFQNVLEIGERAFYNCPNLKTVSFFDSATFQENKVNLQKIGSEAFGAPPTYSGSYISNKIKSITIPASVTEIDSQAFFHCENLQTVTFKNPNGWWYALDSSSTSVTRIDSSDLSDTSTAVGYLTNNYYSYFLRRD